MDAVEEVLGDRDVVRAVLEIDTDRVRLVASREVGQDRTEDVVRYRGTAAGSLYEDPESRAVDRDMVLDREAVHLDVGGLNAHLAIKGGLTRVRKRPACSG